MSTRFVAPFEIQPFPKYIRDELERRERDVGVNFISNTVASWDDNGNWNTYKGPMRCWVRVCSNGIGDVKYMDPKKDLYLVVQMVFIKITDLNQRTTIKPKRYWDLLRLEFHTLLKMKTPQTVS
jgi:hypothetical protein